MASSRRTGTSENVSTYGGGGRDYTSLATWEAATDVDLVTATTSEVLECYADSATFDDTLNLAGATTNSTYFRIIRAASTERHGGIPGAGVKFITSTNPTQHFLLNESNFSLQDIELYTESDSGAGNRPCISISGGDEVTIVGCLLHADNDGGGNGHGIVNSVSSGTQYFINCIFWDCSHTGFLQAGAGTGVLYNCTLTGGVTGISRTSGTCLAKNVLSYSNTTDFSGTFSASSEGNISQDGTEPGGGPFTATTVTFVDEAGNDYHLAATDYGAFQRGLDLSSDGTFAFDDDIDLTTISVWSVGADAQATHISARRRGVGEVISTYGNGTRDYTSLTTWEAATDNDLVTSKVSEVLECYADSASFSDSISLAGAVANASYRRIVRAAVGEEHAGIVDAGVVFSTASVTCIDLLEDFASIQDIGASVSANSASAAHTYRVSGVDSCLLVGCISSSCVNAGAGSEQGYFITTSDLTVLVDCISIDSDNRGFNLNTSGNTVYLYNCTAADNVTGFLSSAGTVIVKNCLASGNSTADFSGTFASGTIANVSVDGTEPGAAPFQASAVVYADEASNDFHLGATDTGALQRGFDLSADSTFPFMDDIDKDEILLWSVGADAQAAFNSSRRRAVGEVISTYGNGTRDYTSITTWESATDNDLVTAQASQVLECYADSAEFTEGGVIFTGAVVDANFFRILRAASTARHDGVPGGGVKFVHTTQARILDIAEDRFWVQDIEAEQTMNDAGAANIAIRVTGDFAGIVGCIAKSTNAGAGTGFGFSQNQSAGETSYVVNCMGYDSKTRAFNVSTSGTAYFLNCTALDSGEGFQTGTTTTRTNCLADGNSTDFATATGTDSYNASSDASASGTGSRTSQTFTFRDETGNDFRLYDTDAGAQDFGNSQAALAAFPFNDDIEYSQITTWSIGFDSDPPTAPVVTGGGALYKLRRRQAWRR